MKFFISFMLVCFLFVGCSSSPNKYERPKERKIVYIPKICPDNTFIQVTDFGDVNLVNVSLINSIEHRDTWDIVRTTERVLIVDELILIEE